MNNIDLEKNITVKEVAKIMKKHEMFIRIGLQNGTLPFGTAEKMPGKSKYSYYISPRQFYQYIGMGGLRDENDSILYRGYDLACNELKKKWR